jgi:hypothetical protein
MRSIVRLENIQDAGRVLTSLPVSWIFGIENAKRIVV